MSSLGRIKQNILKTLSRSTGLPDTALVHPVREWNIGVIVFMVIVGTGVLGAWFAYSYYGNINLGSETGVAEKLNYKRSDALAALEVYTKREAMYQELLLQAPEEDMAPQEEEVTPESTTALIEAGLLGTDGQTLPQFPDAVVVEPEAPPTLDISE
jgi:hypothetical protein